MTRTITKQEATNDFEEILGSLSSDSETVIVDDDGERVAVVISPEEFDRYAHARAWEVIRQIQERNADKDPDEVMRIVTEVVEEVRQEAYEKQLAASRGH